MEFTTPTGFRDVMPDEARAREAIIRKVQDLFAGQGYDPIETPTLESMASLQAAGRIPASPFKFLDATGDLVTMRPDVTLQVARMGATRLRSAEGPLRLRYVQRIFRDTSGQRQAEVREKTQLGIELLGEEGPSADAEVLGLLVQTFETAGLTNFQISVATVGVLRALLTASEMPPQWQSEVLAAYHGSNFVALDALCAKALQQGSPTAAAISALAHIRGGEEAVQAARDLVTPFNCEGALDALSRLQQTYDLLAQRGLASKLTVDFSAMSSFDYYTGIVFEAFAPGVGAAIGGGGRYDGLLGNFGTQRPAAGFAFNLEELMAALAHGAAQRPLRIAVPKGSLYADSLETLAAAGLPVQGLEDPGRTLIIGAPAENPTVEYIIVRPSDAPIFVETGAADCGICGEDSLVETAADVVELADLRFGACRFIVAAPVGSAAAVQEHYKTLGSIRVATKYPRIAKAHFDRRATQVEIVELRGNIELGPLTGLSDCIVDITATGTTLRENNLEVTDEVMSSTARFFANTASFRTNPRVRALGDRLRQNAESAKIKVTAGGAVA